MNVEEKNTLEAQFNAFKGKEVKISKLNPSGKHSLKFYILTNYSTVGVCFGDEKGTNIDTENMFYHLRAILIKKDESEEINSIPLNKVINAIKKGEVIYYQ